MQAREAAREMEHIIHALDVGRGHLAAPGGAANVRELRGKADPLTAACVRHPGRGVDRSGDASPTEAVPHMSRGADRPHAWALEELPRHPGGRDVLKELKIPVPVEAPIEEGQ